MWAPCSRGAEVCLERALVSRQKIILNIFWPGGLMRAVANKIQERNDGREKEFKRIYKRTNTPGINYGNYGGVWRRGTGPHEVVGGGARGDFAYRGSHSPGARF